MESLNFNLKYIWEPFTSQGVHLPFEEHRSTRLTRSACSHWGAAVYKWEGPVTEGPHTGKVGVLIGETEDLRQRIKQYVSGTQVAGNKYWREQFLEKGIIRLYILGELGGEVTTPDGGSLAVGKEGLRSNNTRLVVEQLLVLREIARADPTRWIVNRKL